MSPSFRVHQEQQEELENNKKKISSFFLPSNFQEFVSTYRGVLSFTFCGDPPTRSESCTGGETDRLYNVDTRGEKRHGAIRQAETREREVKALFFYCVYWSGFRDIGGLSIFSRPCCTLGPVRFELAVEMLGRAGVYRGGGRGRDSSFQF
jgi:hypothetical protein